MKASLEISQTLQDYKKILQNMKLLNVEQIIKKIRPVCMAELKKKSLRLFRDAIGYVYIINRERVQNSIPLQELLQAVQAQDKGDWGFVLFINENEINFVTARGTPVPLISQDTDPADRDRYVHELYDHWRTPIKGQREDDWYISIAYESIIKYIKTDFVKYVQSEAQKAVKGGK